MSSRVRGIIAEDEPLLAQALEAELAAQWPELEIVRSVGDGRSALQACLEQAPEVVFLDIKMPELTGLEVAQELFETWSSPQRFPSIVFVTAYDEFALQAFDARALDYLVKPVRSERVAQTVTRLKQSLQKPLEVESLAEQLRNLLPHTKSNSPKALAPLTTLQIGIGQKILMLPVSEVLFFEAADKYVRVVDQQGKDYLMRKPLRELQEELNPHEFWQVHRGTLVRAAAISSVQKDEAGRTSLHLRGYTPALAVSRLYAGLFKAM